MLGPALTNLLHRLAEIPAPDRTPNQQALFEELNWLFAASLGEGPGDAASAQTNALRAAPEIQSFLDSDLVKAFRLAPTVAALRNSRAFASITYSYDPTANAPMSTYPLDPASSGQKCNKCKQYFPVSTQPSV